jgi:hypothetical protein
MAVPKKPQPVECEEIGYTMANNKCELGCKRCLCLGEWCSVEIQVSAVWSTAFQKHLLYGPQIKMFLSATNKRFAFYRDVTITDRTMHRAGPKDVLTNVVIRT